MADFATRSLGIAYTGGSALLGCVHASLAVFAAVYFWMLNSRVFLFWAAFILTRPLGAAMGDFLDKPLGQGRLNFSRPPASAVLAIAIIILVLVLSQRAARNTDQAGSAS